jgi:hypothetical protein
MFWNTVQLSLLYPEGRHGQFLGTTGSNPPNDTAWSLFTFTPAASISS